MTGTVRETMAGLRARLDERRDDPALPSLPGDLFATADLVVGDTPLRVALSDAGQQAQSRVGLVRSLFSDRLSPLAVDVLGDVVAQRWPSPTDMVEAIEELGTTADMMLAQRVGTLDQVEDEVFAFSQVLSASSELQMALTDPAAGTAAKAALIDGLLAGRALPETVQTLSYAMSHLRGRRADAVLDRIMDLAAEQRDRSVAEVIVARPLEPDQAQRLSAVLSRLHGRDVRLNVVVDPDVVGGIAVRIGDQVVDSTVATRLQQARRALVG